MSIGKVNFPVALYIPANYEKKPIPAILFLHGSGESGFDGKKQCQVGLGKSIINNPHLLNDNALVIFPQIPTTMNWSVKQGFAVAMLALKLVDDLFFIDHSRVYLTGISMGATGAWILAENYPNIFAAIIPIAAAVDITEKTQNLVDTPIWAFQSLDDEICPPDLGVKERIKFLSELGNEKIKYTEYTLTEDELNEKKDFDFSFAHKLTWNKAYETPELYEWMFSQRLKDIITE